MLTMIRTSAFAVGSHLARHWGKYILGTVVAGGGTAAVIYRKELQALFSKKQGELINIQAELEGVRRHNAELITKRNEAEGKLEETVRILREKEMTIEALRKRVGEAPSHGELANLRLEVARLSKELESSAHRVAELEGELASSKEREKNLQKLQIELSEQVENLQAELKSLNAPAPADGKSHAAVPSRKQNKRQGKGIAAAKDGAEDAQVA